jgi:flagellar biosynthesis protein FlhG
VDFNGMGHRRLLRQLKGLGSFADLVLLDVGSDGGEISARLWSAADEIVLVATTDPTSQVEAYANIKRLAVAGGNQKVRMIVNRVSDRFRPEEVHRRVDRACKRFLDFPIGYLGQIPEDRLIPSLHNSLVVIQTPDAAAANAIHWIARKLLSPCGSSNTENAHHELEGLVAEDAAKVTISP